MMATEFIERSKNKHSRKQLKKMAGKNNKKSTRKILFAIPRHFLNKYMNKWIF